MSRQQIKRDTKISLTIELSGATWTALVDMARGENTIPARQAEMLLMDACLIFAKGQRSALAKQLEDIDYDKRKRDAATH